MLLIEVPEVCQRRRTVGIDLPRDAVLFQRLPDGLGEYRSGGLVGPTGRGSGEGVQAIRRGAAQYRREEAVGGGELAGEPVVIGKMAVVEISHGAEALLIEAGGVARVVCRGIDKAVHGSVRRRRSLAIKLAMAFVRPGTDLFLA